MFLETNLLSLVKIEIFDMIMSFRICKACMAIFIKENTGTRIKYIMASYFLIDVSSLQLTNEFRCTFHTNV